MRKIFLLLGLSIFQSLGSYLPLNRILIDDKLTLDYASETQ